MRFPGGEKADNYLWSIPPFNGPNPHFARTGGCEWPSNDTRFAKADFSTVKPEGLDFDEFMTMCQAAGGEPLIVVAYDAMYKPASCGTIPTKSQLIQTAVEWVRYANITKHYNIKYWMIGNESFKSCDYNGCATAAQYRDDIIQFSQAMKAVDPSIKIIVNGESSNWWSTILPTAAPHIDFLGISNYPVWQYTGGYDYYKNNTPDLMKQANIAINAINSYAPAAHKSRIKIISTEINSMDWQGSWADNNDLGHAIVNFEMMGEHLKNPKVEGALLWNTRWINNATKPYDLYDAIDKNGNLLAIGKAMEIWSKNLLPKMVQTTSTGKIRTFASYDPVTQALNVFIINKDVISQQVNVNFQNYLQNATMETWEWSGSGAADVTPDWTKKNSKALIGSNKAMTLSPVSVTLMKFRKLNPLPIALVVMKSVFSGENEIRWKAETEGRSGSYTVERSANGVDFSPVGTVWFKQAPGLNEYSLVDNSPAEKGVSYRLQISNGDDVTYSEIAVAKETPSVISSFDVYPNPATNQVKLRPVPAVQTEVTIHAYSPDGKLVYSERAQPENGAILLDVEPWARGMYILKLKAGDKEFTEKLLVN